MKQTTTIKENNMKKEDILKALPKGSELVTEGLEGTHLEGSVWHWHKVTDKDYRMTVEKTRVAFLKLGYEKVEEKVVPLRKGEVLLEVYENNGNTVQFFNSTSQIEGKNLYRISAVIQEDVIKKLLEDNKEDNKYDVIISNDNQSNETLSKEEWDKKILKTFNEMKELYSKEGK